MAAKLVPGFEAERAMGAPWRVVCGVDEAGRGPWAGPVVAAAVVLDPDRIPDGLADSKALSAPRRVALCAELRTCAEIGIGLAMVDEIDRLNILVASELAMCRAVAALGYQVDGALIDGNRVPPDLGCPAEALVAGEERSASIAAASIVAKVVRDRIMDELARANPGYGWERNRGYGTPEHRAALARLGPSPQHRRSFAPVHNMLRSSGCILSQDSLETN